MLNFCIFVFIIYAVAYSVKSILGKDFKKSLYMFEKGFKSKDFDRKPTRNAQKSKIVKIKVPKTPKKRQIKRAA